MSRAATRAFFMLLGGAVVMPPPPVGDCDPFPRIATVGSTVNLKTDIAPIATTGATINVCKEIT